MADLPKNNVLLILYLFEPKAAQLCNQRSAYVFDGSVVFIVGILCHRFCLREKSNHSEQLKTKIIK